MRVGVVGLGLIGGSVARRLHARGVDVWGVDTRVETRAQAVSTGIPCLPDVAALGAADPAIVVLAVPLRAMRAAAFEVAAHAPRAVVTDVGSVKGAVREAARAAGIGGRYVGAHPMAGTELSGFAASSQGLLVGATWAVTVDETSDPDAFLAVLDLVIGPLAGTVRVLSDEVHDEAAALVSHVPHVLATELLNLVADAPVREAALGLAAGSFRDGTRVARTDPRRTEAMVADNAAWVAPALRVVIRDLELLVSRLETNASVGEFFDRAEHLRAAWDNPPAGAGAPQTIEVGPSGWAEALVDEGERGAVVVGHDGAARTVTVAR